MKVIKAERKDTREDTTYQITVEFGSNEAHRAEHITPGQIADKVKAALASLTA